MTPEEAREYSEALGLIATGTVRQIVWAFDQRIPEALGMSRREWVETYHGYSRMPVEDRREAVAELAEEGRSQREIADALGVSEGTVRNDLAPRKITQPEPDPEPGDAQNYAPEPEPEPESDPHADDWRRQRTEERMRAEAVATWHGRLWQTMDWLAGYADHPNAVEADTARYDPEGQYIARLTSSDFDRAAEGLALLRKALL